MTMSMVGAPPAAARATPPGTTTSVGAETATADDFAGIVGGMVATLVAPADLPTSDAEGEPADDVNPTAPSASGGVIEAAVAALAATSVAVPSEPAAENGAGTGPSRGTGPFAASARGVSSAVGGGPAPTDGSDAVATGSTSPATASSAAVTTTHSTTAPAIASMTAPSTSGGPTSAPPTPSGGETAAFPAPVGRDVAAPVAGNVVDSANAPAGHGPVLVPATAGTAPAEGSAPAAPGTPAGTASQLAPAVFAVHRRGVDGTHRLTVEISPEELGPVRLTVAMRAGEVHLLLAGSSEVSREALRAALPELRKLLDAAGLATGTFDVQPDQSDSRPDWSGLSRGGPHDQTGPGRAERPPPRDRPEADAVGSDGAPSHHGDSADRDRPLDLHL
jgi:flagellar hook-length control protein FliK